MENKTPFTLIQGDKDENERLFQELIDAPHAFTLEEFDARVKRFRNRLSFEAIEALLLRRVENYPFKDTLEQQMLLTILRGDYQEHERLCAIHAKRERLGLKVLKGKAGKKGAD
ncbi:MAG TPA: hypothetical protein ENJ35_10150 [Gammaproteobacteria bacterium]|nr:hypothetical protein [Gammaproteobacteria bacterium]